MARSPDRGNSEPSSRSGAFASFSAFDSTLASLRELVRVLEIDLPALQRPLRRCELGRCRGTCCHDGVYLDPDEAPVLRELIADHRTDIEALGVSLPEEPIVMDSWRDSVAGPKTATRAEPMSQRAEHYPAHFPDTACVFLLPDARCALQQWATNSGLDPWYFKPATCWLHPLSIESPEDRREAPQLTIHDRASDPQRFPDYAGFSSFTPCGAIQPTVDAEPAWRILSAEIERLGRIGGRDLLGEIESAIRVDSQSASDSGR